MTTTAPIPPVAADQSHERLLRRLGKEVKEIRVIHPDLFGRQRGKMFPASFAATLFKGIAYSKMSVAEDLFGTPVDEMLFPELAGHPDIHAEIDATTVLGVPWEPDAVWVIADLMENGAPSPLSSRGQLALARDQLTKELGYTVQAAGEPEFYLFTANPGGKPLPYSVDGVSYTIGRITDPGGAVGRMHRALADFGIGITAVNREFSPGQFEINLDHAEVIVAADRIFLLKNAIRELAIIEGLQANFMAKPMTGEEGSSLHVHLSMWDGEENAFAAEGAGLSPVARAAIAGIQAHAPAIMAFAAPTVNSYKRVNGNGLSPKSSNWGEDNRFAFLRVPVERGGATRIELRAGDASANPHLLMAAMIHAARDGIARELEPDAQGVALPGTLAESISALEIDAFLAEAFGSELIAVYCALKRAEINSAASAVTDWEWNLYSGQV